MRVFISYRRRGSGYLARWIEEDLGQRSESMDVIADTSAIRLGEEFPEAIRTAIEQSDVVLALIGASWAPERLKDPDDFVRQELETAHQRGKRIVPALHDGVRDLTVTALPDDMDWLRWLNAFTFGNPSQLEADLDRLYAQLTNRVPVLAELQAKAWRLYEQGSDGALLETVAQAWAEHASQPSPALADCCRIAALVMTRGTGEAGVRDMWLARALSTAYQSGAGNVLAASLLPFFFRLSNQGETSAAREVLGEIRRLTVRQDREDFPPTKMIARLYHEKLGHTYLVDMQSEEALAAFDAALDVVDDLRDERGMLKIRASRALCWHMQGRTADARTETEAVLEAASQGGYRDLAERTEHNLGVMDAGLGGFAFYEVT